MRRLLASLCLLHAAVAARAESLPAFGSYSLPQLRAARSPSVAPGVKAADVLDRYHLLIQAGKDVLFGFADTDAQYQEAAAYWSAALRSAGIEAGTPSFEDGKYQLPYRTPDGSVLRVFLADPRQFPPRDEAQLRANLALAQGALGRAGLPVVAARLVNVDLILPTYSILYRTRPQADPPREKRLRVLAPGDDMDFDVFRSAGLDVVQTPKTWLMVYLGPEVGYASLAAKTPDNLSRRLSERKEYLVANGKIIIAARTFLLDGAEYKYGAGIYFFQ